MFIESLAICPQRLSNFRIWRLAEMAAQALCGILIFVFIAWVLSENRKRLEIRIVVIGIGIQFMVGLILLKMPFFRDFFLSLNTLILALEDATNAGTKMVFGYLGGGSMPFELTNPGASFILAFQSLPIVLLMSALSALLFYWRILPAIVRLFSVTLQKTMRIGGAEALGVSANVFVGMVEAPLFIRPYMNQLTRSELFTLMTCGMATIAGTVMVLYASILGDKIPNIMGHILTASIISVPAAITISKIMVPETGLLTTGTLSAPEEASGAMDAVTKGTLQGVQLLINIIAMLIVLVAMVHLVNSGLGLLPDVLGQPLRLERLLGWLMAPVAWLMGVPWTEAPIAGALLGSKTVLNEFIAYLEMTRLQDGLLSESSMIIMTYAMCGFANPGSLGIMIGGLGTMAPGRREEIVALGFRSIVAGTLSTCMTGAIVGIIY